MESTSRIQDEIENSLDRNIDSTTDKDYNKKYFPEEIEAKIMEKIMDKVNEIRHGTEPHDFPEDTTSFLVYIKDIIKNFCNLVISLFEYIFAGNQISTVDNKILKSIIEIAEEVKNKEEEDNNKNPEDASDTKNNRNSRNDQKKDTIFEEISLIDDTDIDYLKNPKKLPKGEHTIIDIQEDATNDIYLRKATTTEVKSSELSLLLNEQVNHNWTRIQDASHHAKYPTHRTLRTQILFVIFIVIPLILSLCWLFFIIRVIFCDAPIKVNRKPEFNLNEKHKEVLERYKNIYNKDSNAQTNKEAYDLKNKAEKHYVDKIYKKSKPEKQLSDRYRDVVNQRGSIG